MNSLCSRCSTPLQRISPSVLSSALANCLWPNSPPRHLARIGVNCGAPAQSHAIVFIPPPGGPPCTKSFPSFFRSSRFRWRGRSTHKSCSAACVHPNLNPKPTSVNRMALAVGWFNCRRASIPPCWAAVVSPSTKKMAESFIKPFRPSRFARPRELLGRPQIAVVYFLFTGDAPLELQLYAPTAAATTITPQPDPVGHERLLSDWWVRYTRQANTINRSADYPSLVDNYLLATLSRRLNLPPASQIPAPPFACWPKVCSVPRQPARRNCPAHKPPTNN